MYILADIFTNIIGHYLFMSIEPLRSQELNRFVPSLGREQNSAILVYTYIYICIVENLCSYGFSGSSRSIQI